MLHANIMQEHVHWLLVSANSCIGLLQPIIHHSEDNDLTSVAEQVCSAQ